MTNTLETAWCLVILDFRTVSGGKGATSTANSQRQQELNMQTQAFNTQQGQLKMLNSMLSPALRGTQGYTPEAMAAFRASLLNSNNQTFNQAGQMVRSALGARGEGTGGNPVGGNYAAGLSDLLGAKASGQSQGLLNIDMNNANLANQNKWNAANILSGNAATLTGTQGVAGSAASSALNSYITASNSGFLGSFQNSLGKGLGAGVSSFATGGLGKLGGMAGMAMGSGGGS